MNTSLLMLLTLYLMSVLSGNIKDSYDNNWILASCQTYTVTPEQEHQGKKIEKSAVVVSQLSVLFSFCPLLTWA